MLILKIAKHLCRQLVSALASGSVWARDLINTPAEDLGPQHLAAEAAALAAAHGAAITTLVASAVGVGGQRLG
ncbi:hypothetical protein V8C86DRAFT_2699090 [Haematococcus lacustris]